MGDLKAEAYRYWEMGFNVVALFFVEGKDGKVEKRSFVEWGKWHTQRQTEQEFNNQPWDKADGFGVVCSFPNNDGLFLAVVDYDVKKVSEEAKERGKTLLSRLAITQMEQTISGGTHYVYLSRVKASQSHGVFHDTHALELIATGKLCVLAPSKGYRRLNDNEPTILEDVEGVFLQVLGVEDKRAQVNDGLADNLLQKWLEQVKTHLEVKGEGSQYVYCRCPFHKPDKNPSFALHKTKFYGVDFHDNKVFSLKELAKALGITLEDGREGYIELEGLSVKPLLNSHWISLHPAIDVNGNIAYIGIDLPCELIDKKGHVKLENMHFLISSDKQQILCHKQTLAREKLKLAHGVVEMRLRWSPQSIKAWLEGKASVEPAQVYSAVRTVFENFMEFGEDVVYDFVTLWAIGTYFFILFNAYPYLYIGGMKRVGKTKLLTLFFLICFNAIFSGNMSTSSLFRLVQSGRSTVLLDETEKLSNPDKAEEFRNLLLNGYKKGGVVYRTNKDTGKPEAFEVYSPKAVANIKGLEDILEDRCIPLILTRGKNPNLINSEPKEENPIWQQIRDMLYTFFLQSFSELNVISERSEVSGDTPLKERDRELWLPILTLAKYFNQWFNGLYDKILEFAKRKVQEKQIENMTETGEYLLVQALMKLVNSNNYYKVKDIKEAVQKLFDEPQKWLTTKWIGNALRRLGFMDKRRVGTGYEYRLTPEAVEDLAGRLNVLSSPPSLERSQHSESSVSSLVRLDDLVSVYWRDEPLTEKECGVCGYVKPTCWVAETVKGEEIAVCEDCVQTFRKLRGE